MAINVIRQTSPGIVVNEIEYTNDQAIVGRPTVGVFVGDFSWGPINSPVLLSNNAELRTTFAIPRDQEEISSLGSSYFTVYNTLSYQGSKVYVNRVAGANVRNSYNIKTHNYIDYGVGGVTSTNVTANTAANGVYLYVPDDTFTSGLEAGMKVYKETDIINGKNYLLYTQQIDKSAYWNRLNVGVTKDVIPAPIGVSGNTVDVITANEIVDAKYPTIFSITRSQHPTKNKQFLASENIVYDTATKRVTTSPFKASSKICFSAYIKPNGCTRAKLRVAPTLEPQNTFFATFILTGNGSIYTTKSVGTIAQSANNATITPVGSDGWYRCSIACNANTVATANAGMLTYSIEMGKSNTMTQAITSGEGLYVWGLQAEKVENTATATPKAYFENEQTIFHNQYPLGTIESVTSDANNVIIELSTPVDKEIEDNTELYFKTDIFNNNLKIINEEDLSAQIKASTDFTKYGPFAARYAGELGDSIKVAVCSSGSKFTSWNETINGVVYDYSSYFEEAPGTSKYVQNLNEEDEINGDYNYGQNDEIHILVIDSKGLFTGKVGNVLEIHRALSKASDVIGPNGKNFYFKDYINKYSNYIYCLGNIDPDNTNSTWGKSCTKVNAFASVDNYIAEFSGGVSDEPSTSEINSGWDKFKEIDNYDFDSVITGDASEHANTILDYVYDNIVNYRKDCVMFVSPPSSAVIEQSGDEANNIVDFFTGTFTKKSSYIVADNNWKYQYDALNRIYRWVPMNGDVAGLCSRTDKNQDSWYSPAGYNRGKILNVTKLAWSANKQDRDTLYKKSINPIVTQSGEGTLLLGDKTLMNKSSVFGHINVRRLFLTLEKTISKAAKLQMFDFNDAFTRARFVAMIEPFLREVQGRRGIVDFNVVCDETNNTADVINDNYFVADIYIKPALSINYIQLNFIAVPQGVEFNTIVL